MMVASSADLRKISLASPSSRAALLDDVAQAVPDDMSPIDLMDDGCTLMGKGAGSGSERVLVLRWREVTKHAAPDLTATPTSRPCWLRP